VLESIKEGLDQEGLACTDSRGSIPLRRASEITVRMAIDFLPDEINSLALF
jgi:hypothetical protein